MYNGKKILVTGGTGMIGVALVRKLLNMGANVKVVSIDSVERAKAVLDDISIFNYGDLRDFDLCMDIAKGMDFVFHLMAVKGNTQIGVTKVASAYVPFLLCNTNMMEAAFRCNVKRYMFVGSIGEYPPFEVRYEDDVWKGAPEANDRFMGIAKRAGEIQAEAYRLEYGWDAVRIVRLSNVYGPYDDFDPKTAHVIPALISRAINGENPIKVAGDGNAMRDFIYLEDVIKGILLAIEKAQPCFPINIGSGVGYRIREVIETIAENVPIKPEIEWDLTKPTGDSVRILSVERAKNVLGFKAETSLKDGIRKTIEWYLKNKKIADRRGKELHG